VPGSSSLLGLITMSLLRQEQLREYYHKAREAFVGHELPREPKGVLVDLGEFRESFLQSKHITEV
jgi:hypothetical protein